MTVTSRMMRLERLEAASTTAIQRNAEYFDETKRSLDDVKIQVSVVQSALQGLSRSDLNPNERRQITKETVEYINNSQSTNLSTFSPQTLSVIATELAGRMLVAYHHWVSEDEVIVETFAVRITVARTTEEKQRLETQKEKERNELLRKADSEFARVLSEALVVCNEMLQ